MNRLVPAAIAGALLMGVASPASALTSKECSAKFKADPAAAGRKYADYRKAECGTGASAQPTAAAPTAPAAPAAPAVTRRAAPKAPASASGYPSAIDPKYASESPGKGRMHTCLDAYKAAKAAGTLGDRKWIQKGGGYYSACNAGMKG